MQQLKHKQKRPYVGLPRELAEKTSQNVDLHLLRKEITRQWRGAGAVEEIRAQRRK